MLLKLRYSKDRDAGSNKENSGHGSALVLEKSRAQLGHPCLYRVMMMNDDYTPMDFVVHVLEAFFGMQREQATRVMLTVHTEGKAVCGTYSRDVAETKTEQVNRYAQENEHPLTCNIEVAEYDGKDGEQ
jgi:ATP-dependent Clp protease adaptor protein ClpS